MTEYAPTARLGLILPVVGTGQAWSTQKYINDNFTKVETEAVLTDTRLDAVELLTLPASSQAGVVPAGTTAQRDAFWGGAPANAAARVVLANKFPRWFNTDKGYEQQYFAQFDDGGAATTPAKKVFGWGPAMHLGRVPVKPTSIAATGTSVVAQQHGGAVDFSACATISLNGVFTADFSNYEVIIETDSAAADASTTLRVRVAGVDLSTSTYGINQIENTAGGALGGGAPGSATSANIGRISSVGDAVQQLLISKPFATKRTDIMGQSFDATLYQRLVANSVQNAVSYDGFTVIFNTTAVVGRIRVYGINDY